MHPLLLTFGVLTLSGCVVSINIDFYDSNDGFFLKSTYHNFKPSEPNIVKESLILTHPAEVYKLRASYGPFEMYQSVPNKVLSNVVQFGEDVWDKSQSSMHRQVLHNMDVSAHLVSREGIVRHSNPLVQLLVHAQPMVRRQSQHIIYSYYGYSQRWCARLFVSKGGEQYTSACVLAEGSNACVVSMHLPDHWWGVEGNTTLKRSEVLVFYDLSGVEQNQECASVSNTIVPAQDAQSTTDKKFITSLKLVHDDHLVTADRDAGGLVFRVPQSDLASGVKFEVPVLLESLSSVTEFVAQVQVKGNLVIDGASTGLHSRWDVFFEAGDTDRSAIVTAFLKENSQPQQSDGQEEVMRWQFRVLQGVSSPTTARISWTVGYDRNTPVTDTFLSEGTTVSTKLNILASPAVKIIPVHKERSLLNTAILSGKQVIHSLTIFSVAPDNTLRDVTKDSYCSSYDKMVVKVSRSCNQFYLDGSETRGSKNVTILVRLGDNRATFSLRVWVPEHQLDLQLSDTKLSQVRRWKVPSVSGSATSQMKRTANPAQPGSPSGGFNKTSKSGTCSLKYQQSQVDVYARFTISTPGEGTDYYRSKKTFVRVTDLVLSRLQIGDPSVAKMKGQTVQGVAPGKTQVQIISPTGKLLGFKEIRVAKDKVDIERLMVRVISGMGLHIDEMRNLPGALLATVYLRDQLVAKQQEAVLDIALQFKDNTMLPISSIDPEEYDLTVTSVNDNIVEVTGTTSSISASIPPSIKAVGNGKGEIIKVTLKEKNSCERKKPRTLDTEYVHVQVDFAKNMDHYNRVQSDGYYISNKDHNSQQKYYKSKEEYFKNVKSSQDANRDYGDKFSKLDPKVHPLESKHETFTVSSSNGENNGITKDPPKSEALEQPVSTKAKHPTPLEVAMYVLVAVFVFAILVFTANCAVFMVRHNRKCKPHHSSSASFSKPMLSNSSSKTGKAGSISQAPDWVWIGRATLERQGAGNAGLDHALMAEEDFNGNQMVVPHPAPSRSSSRRSSKKLGVNDAMSRSGSSSSGHPATSASSGRSGGSNRNSVVSTYQGSECSIRITANPLLQEEEDATTGDDLGGMGYNEAEWDYEAMGMTYEQLMDYFDNLKESSA